MANKTEQFDFDDDTFWKELDEPSTNLGGFSDSSQKGGRRKAVIEFAGSFLSGVKKTLLDPSNQRKFLADNMPDGYAATFDAASMGAQGIKNIYRSTKDELDKSLGDMAEDAATLNKHYGKVLPKRLQDKIAQKLEGAGNRTYRSPTEEETLNEDLNGVFAELAEVQRTAALANKQTSETTANRIVASQNNNTVAVSVSNRILSNISGSNEKLVGINFTNGKLARKQIELTFKSFVVQRQMLDTLQQTKDLQEKAFKLLIQNTGLPEAVKLTNWELAGKSLKQKMVGMATERMTASFAPTASHIFDRVRENFSNKAGMAGGTASMIMSMLAMQASMGEMGGSKAGMAGEFAGQAGGNILQWYLRKKLGDRFKNDPRFKRYGDSAMNFMDSFPGTFNKLQNNYGGFSRMMHALGVGDILTPDSALKTRVRASAHKHFDEVVSFNKKSEIALTEVIPGWLGKVHHQLKIMASGDQNAEEERYDYEKAGFTTKSDLYNRTRGAMYQKDSLKDSKAKANRIVNSLDKKGELSKKDREVLMRYVLQQANSDTGFIDPAALMDTLDSPLNKYDPKAAARIAGVLSNENNFNHIDGGYDGMSDKSILFGNMNSDANYQATMRSSNDLLKELRRVMPNAKNVAVREAGVGNIDLLREMGAVKWDNNNKEWKFDNDVMYNSILSGKGPGSSPNGPRPGGGSPYTPPGFGGGPSPTSPTGGNPFGGPDMVDGGLSTFQQELLETIERTSARASIDVGNQLLESIRQRLEMGVPQGGEAAPVQQQDRKANWFRRMLSGSMQSTGKGLKSYFKFATVKAPNAIFRNFVQAPLRVARGIMDLPSRMFGRSTTSVIDSTSKKFGKVMGDLYVRGKENAVIKVADLKAGNYIDATSKKVIKSFKDIKGAILDKDGNVVITEEEVKNGLYTIINGKTFSILGGALRAGMSVLSGIVKGNFAGLSAVTGMGRSALRAGRAIFGFMGGAPDVYVQGETSPRLLSRIMRSGGYFNKDGSLIKSVNDIRGDVVDATGDVILSVADMAKGLVDKRGRPFKSIGDRIRGLLLAPAKMAMKAVSAVTKLSMMPFKLLNKGRKGIMSFFSGKKDSTPEQVLQAGSLDTLNKIYGLLDERMPKSKGSWFDQDGSGFRDGSRDDVLSRRGKKEDGVKTPEEDEGKKDRKGILGMLMAIAGGIGGLIGTVKGWAKNIFALMRLAAQARMASSAMDLAGGVLGAAGGSRGRGGKLGALFRGAKNFVTKTKVGKVLAAGAIVGGAIGFSRSSWGSDAIRGAADAMNGSGGEAEKEALAGGDFGSAPSSGGSGSGSGGGAGGEQGDQKSLLQRVLTGAGGGMLGEMAAIAAFPAMAALYQKAQGTKLGSKVLPTFRHEQKPTGPQSKLDKVKDFFLKTKKGRLALAGLLGGGFVGAQSFMGNNDSGVDLGDETASSMKSTLLFDLAAATAVPFGIAKGKQWYDNYKARKGAVDKLNSARQFSPVNPAAGPTPKGVFNPGVNPTMGRSPMVGPMPPIGAGTPAMAANAGAAAKAGIGSKLAGAGKGIFRNAGILGTGYAAYDALTTQGTLWDKTKAFGTSLATSAAIGKGLSIGGQMFSAAGRQALMQGGRTGAVALASTLGAPVVLGALAVAAAGYGAWKGYKYFFGTDKNAIVRFRMAQYGFDLDDKEKATVIGQFEQLCQKNAVVDNSGKAYFKKNISADAIFKLFGIQESDKQRISDFITWFGARFKPAFLKAFAFYKGKTKNTTLEKADSLPKPDKLAMLNAMGAVTGKPSPYSITVTPFPDGKKLTYDDSAVQSELKKALRNVGNEKGPGEKSITERVKDSFSNAWEKTKTFGKDVLETAGNVGGFIKETTVNAFNAGAAGVRAAGGAVANVAGGFWGGVKRAAGTVGGTISQAWNDTTGGAGFFKGSGGSAGDLPKPSGKGWKAVKATILGAAKMVGVDPVLMIAIAAVESGFDPSAKAGSSSAAGLFQFISSTWNAMVSKYGQTYGIPNGTSPLDGRANSILGACYIKDNAQVIKRIKGNVSATDVYMAHFLGSGGVSTFLKAMMKNSQAPAANLLPAAAKANKTIFYNSGRARTLSEVYSLMQNKLATRAKQFGVEAEYLAGIGGTADSGKSEVRGIPFKDAGQGTAGGALNNNTGGGSGGGGGGGSMGGGGWFGYMMGGGRPISAASTEGGGFGGGNSLTAGAASGSIITAAGAADFIKSIDPKLIKLGRDSTKLADKDVDVAGMVQAFMVCFYGMIGEAVQRGVLKNVLVNSANRSFAKQKALYDAYVRDPKHNPMAAAPGKSRHNFGVAIDISSAHANALAQAGLLEKYGFTRPLLNHPRKPEPWHLESKYFKKGSGDTSTEVAKATKDSGNKSKVEKAKKDEAKTNPIVKAEKSNPKPSTTQIPMKPVNTSSAEAKLKSMSSGFAGGSAWGATDRSSAPVIETPTSVVNKYLDKATTSKPSAASAEVTQNHQRANMESATQAMIDIQSQQLQVQQEMVGVLHEIRDTLQTTGIKGGASAQAEATAAPQSSSANRAAEMIRAKSRDIPVSMSINR